MTKEIQRKTNNIEELQLEVERLNSELKLKQQENDSSRSEISKLKSKIIINLMSRFYWRSLALLVAVFLALFVDGPMIKMLTTEIKDPSLAWIYAVKVMGILLVYCGLLWLLLGLIQSDPDRVD